MTELEAIKKALQFLINLEKEKEIRRIIPNFDFENYDLVNWEQRSGSRLYGDIVKKTMLKYDSILEKLK